MITGCVYIDLTFDPFTGAGDNLNRDRHQLDVLEICPDGVRVVINIGDRRFVTPDTAQWIGRHVDRLLIEMHGTNPAAIARFVRAGRGGDWSVVA